MRLFLTIAISFLYFSALFAQNKDVIERDYFPGARAKNAAIAASRYAQEGYYYTKFNTYISTVDSSRLFADTALFFVKRSLMLADTSLRYAPVVNYPAIDFLQSGKARTANANKIIRDYYPMRDVVSHHAFSRDALLDLSNAVMEFYNASLLLNAEEDADEDETNRYEVLPYSAEVIRLEVDETSFQMAANALEQEIKDLETLSSSLRQKIDLASDQKTRFALRENLDRVEQLISKNISDLKDTSVRMQEIRQLLTKKHLADVENLEEPEHLSFFETSGTQKTIEMDTDIPDGLVYKIQLGYYPSDVDIKHFHGLFPISGETVRKDLTRIYAGLFYSYRQAVTGNEYVRDHVIANAFIVPFRNGEKISISTAIEMELQRGVR